MNYLSRLKEDVELSLEPLKNININWERFPTLPESFEYFLYNACEFENADNRSREIWKTSNTQETPDYVLSVCAQGTSSKGLNRPRTRTIHAFLEHLMIFMYETYPNMDVVDVHWGRKGFKSPQRDPCLGWQGSFAAIQDKIKSHSPKPNARIDLYLRKKLAVSVQEKDSVSEVSSQSRLNTVLDPISTERLSTIDMDRLEKSMPSSSSVLQYLPRYTNIDIISDKIDCDSEKSDRIRFALFLMRWELGGLNTWKVFSSMKDLLLNIKESPLTTNETAICHVGIPKENPLIPEESYLLSKYNGLVLLSAAARFTLSKHFTQGALPIGEIENKETPLLLFLPSRHFGHTIQSYEEKHLEISTKSQNDNNEPTTLWIIEFLKTRESLRHVFVNQRVLSDEDWVNIRSQLDDDLVLEVDAFRYRFHLQKFLQGDDISMSLNFVEWFKTLPLTVLKTEITSPLFSVRVQNACNNAEIMTVGDLCNYTEASLFKLRSFGRGSWRNLLKTIHELSVRVSLSQVSDETPESLKQIVDNYLQQLPIDKQKVFQGRVENKDTLSIIGSVLNLSRERVRQKMNEIDSHIKTLIVQKLSSICADVIGKDQYFELFKQFVQSSPELSSIPESHLKHFIQTYLDDVFLIEIQDIVMVSNISERRCLEMRAYVQNILETKEFFGWTYVECRDYLLKATGVDFSKSNIFVDLLSMEIKQTCLIDKDSQKILTTTKNTEGQLKGILRNSEVPMHYLDVYKRLYELTEAKVTERTVHNLLQSKSDVFILFNRGTYGLKYHYPLNDEQNLEVSDLLEELIFSQNKKKQWSTNALLKIIIEDVPIGYAEKLDEFIVGYILTQNASIQSCGRGIFRFGTSSDSATHERLHISNLIETIICNAERPLHEKEVVKRISQERMLRRAPIFTPFNDIIRFGPQTWGSLAKHSRIDVAHKETVLNILLSILEQQQKGIHFDELEQMVFEPNALISDEMSAHILLDLATLDPRFKTYRRFIGLACWDNVRRLTHNETLEVILEGRTEPFVVSELRSLIYEYSNRRINSGLLASLLKQHNWRYNSDKQLWELMSLDTK